MDENNSRIIDSKDRRANIVYPKIVAKAVTTGTDKTLTQQIQEIYDQINMIYITSGREDQMVNSGLKKDNVEEEYVIVNGEKRQIIQTRDHNGTYTYPRTVADAVILNNGSSLTDTIDRLSGELVALDEIVNKFILKNLTLNGSNELVYELGTSLSNVKMEWCYNKDVTSQTVSCPQLSILQPVSNTNYFFKDNDSHLDDKFRTKYYTYDMNLPSTFKPMVESSYAFTVTGHRSTAGHTYTASGTKYIKFGNRIYYGVTEKEMGSEDVKAYLNSELTTSNIKGKKFRLDTGSKKYIYLCVPARLNLNELNLKVGAFPGGFVRLGPVNFTNSQGYVESYHIFRSNRAGLGNVTLEIGNFS